VYCLLGILAIAPNPLTIQEIQYLKGDNHITFHFLALLEDVKGILKIERDRKGNVFSIGHKEFRDVIIDELKENIADILQQCVTYLEPMKNKKVDELTKEEQMLAESIIYFKGIEKEKSQLIRVHDSLLYFFDYKLRQFIKQLEHNIVNGNTFTHQDQLIDEINQFAADTNQLVQLDMYEGAKYTIKLLIYKALIYLKNELMDRYLVSDSNSWHTAEMYKHVYPESWHFNLHSRPFLIYDLLKSSMNELGTVSDFSTVRTDYVKASSVLILYKLFDQNKMDREELAKLEYIGNKLGLSNKEEKWITLVKTYANKTDSFNSNQLNSDLDKLIIEMMDAE
jgi:hypothetical protein